MFSGVNAWLMVLWTITVAGVRNTLIDVGSSFAVVLFAGIRLASFDLRVVGEEQARFEF